MAKLASEDFKVGKTYTGVTVTDGETTKTYASLKAETLSRFSADSVTNNDSIVIMDADFTAGTLDNRAGKTIEAENADIKVTSAFTNAGDVSVSGSAITVGESETPGSLVNSGSIALNTLAAAGDDPAIQSSLTVYGDVTNTGTISYVFIYTNVDDDPETTDVNESQVASSAAQKFHVIGGSVNNAGGTITIDASAFNLEDASKQVTDFAVNGGIVTATGKDEIKAVRDSSKHVYLFNVGAVDMSTLYVDNMDGWSGDIGAEITSGKDWIPGETKPDLYFRINAFTDAATAAEGLAATTDTIVFKGNTGNSYGDLDLSAASDITLSVEPDGSTSVSVGNLTAGNSVTLSALDLAATGVTNTGTLTIDGTASLTASGNVTNTGTISYKFVNGVPSAQVFKVDGSGSVNNAGGTITIDVSDAVFPEAGDRLIQVTDFAVNGGVISITGTAHGLVPGETVTAIRDADNNVWLIATPADTTVLYVDNDSVDAWSGQPGTLIADPTNPDDPYAGWNPDEEKLYYGVNAFSDNGAVNGITADTTTIKIKGGNETSYGDFLFTTITNGITVTTDAGVAKIDALTAGEGKTVTLDSAKLNATGAVTNSGTLTQTGATTGELTTGDFVNSGTFTQTAGTVNAGTLTNAANAEMTFADTVSATTALVNSGTVDQTSGTIEAATLTNAAGAEMTIAGTVEATTLTNTGTLTQTDGTVNAVTFGNSGMFTQSSGTVNVTGTDTFTNNATMTLGGEFHVTSDFTNVGTLNQLGGSMTMGAFTNSANAFAAFAGSATMGDITNETGGKLYQTDGEIRAASLANSGEVELHYGTMKLTDGITNNAGATIKLRDTLIKDDEGNNVKVAGALSGTSLTNAGTFTQTAGVVELTGDITNSSMFTQTSGALSAASLANSAGASASLGGVVELTGAITNSGTFAQTSGTLSAASLTNSAGASASLGGEVELTNIENFGAFVQTGGHLSAGTITQANDQKNDAAMVFNGTLNATSLGNSVEYGAAIELNLKGCENTLESIRNSKGGTIKLTGGTLTVTGVGRSTTDGGISNSGDYFNVGISATEASDAVLNVKNLDMISGNGDGRGGLFVYKNAVLNVGTETENGVLRCNYGYDQRRIDVNGGTVNVFGNVENAGKAGSLGGAFSIIGISMVYVKGTFSGNGNLIFKGVTLDSRTRIVADNGATKNLIVKKDGGKSSLIDGAVISVTSMTVDDGAMTISDTAGTGSFTVTNDITNKKRLKVKDGATLDVGGNITNSEAGKAIDIFAGATINLTGGSDKKISGGILDVGTVNESTGANILTEDFYILVTGAIDDGVTLNVDKLDGKTSWAKTITVGEVSSTTITVGDLRSNGDSGAIGGTDYKVTTLDGKGLYLTKNDPSVLYVSADYTGEAGTITADGHLVGYNAFSSFTEALAKAEAFGSTSIQIVSENYSETVSPSADKDYFFKENLTIGGENVSLSGVGELILRAQDRKITINNDIESAGWLTVSWPKTVTETKYAATTEINSTLASGTNIQIGSIATVSTTGKLSAGNSILVMGPNANTSPSFVGPTPDVTITGTGSYEDGTHDEQIYAQYMILVDGGVSITDSKVYLEQALSFTDENYGRSGGFVTDAHMVSNNTKWDVQDIVVRYYAGTDGEDITDDVRNFVSLTESGGIFTFQSGSVLNVRGNLTNVPYKRIGEGGELAGVIDGAPALTINLDDSTMSVAGYIRNAGTINLKSGSTVSAANITNTGTITVEAGSTVNVANPGSISGGSIDIITVDSNGDSILTDDFYILVNGTIDYANVTITVDGGASAGGLDFNPATDDPLDITTKYKLTTLGGRGLFLTNKDPSVLYVGANYTDAGTIVDGHLVGYNAFSSLDAITDPKAPYSSYHSGAEGATGKYSKTKEINLAAGATGTAGGNPKVYRWFYSDPVDSSDPYDVAITGAGGSEGTETTIRYDRLYLMTALTATTDAEYSAKVATEAANRRKFIIDKDLTLKMNVGHGLLKVGDVLDKGDAANRTGGVADLQVDGILEAAVYAAPYSTVTVTGSGKLINTRNGSDPKQGSYLRNYSQMTVNGADTPAENTNKQIEMKNLTFIDGGTLNLNSTRARISHFRLSGAELNNNGDPVNLLDPTNAVITLNNTWFDTDALPTSETNPLRYFFLYNYDSDPDYPEDIFLNVENASTLKVDGIFNPSAKMTVSLSASELIANSIENAGTITMDKDSLITANSITNSGAGKVEIDAAGFSGMKKVIDLNGSGENPDESITVKAETKPADVALFFDGQDYWLTDADRSTVYVNTAWTGEYGEAVATRKYFGYNATDAISSAVDIAPSTILVTKGTFGGSKAFELKGIATTIQGSVTETVFQKGVYGGATATAAAAEATAVSRNIDLTIEGGSFEKVVVGGDKVQMGSAGDKYYISGTRQTLCISGGLFVNSVAAGDRFEKGELHRTGKVSLNISGGTFGLSEPDAGNIAVAGGMMVATTRTDAGSVTIQGDVEMSITGGTFADTAWIYGGGVATNRNASAASTIDGSTTIRVNADGVKYSGIVLSHVAAGSYGLGTITGDAKIEFIGDGQKDGNAVKFTENGELWGSCGGDSVSPLTGELLAAHVNGDRTLTFTGFDGKLDCSNIRAFSKVEIKDRTKTVNEESTTFHSSVTLDNANFNLSGIKTWEFDCGSTLSGGFTNDFTGDTLILVGFTGITAPQTIMTDTLNTDDRDVFGGFEALSTIWMNSTRVDLSPDDFDSVNNVWTFSAGDYGTFNLSLSSSETSTSMVLAKA
ncbi:MAG: hypothetical protein IJT68_02970 [Lentisphaeria bacterium]|nr:hypothetical protein [Lentisphaeria bacterium]